MRRLPGVILLSMGMLLAGHAQAQTKLAQSPGPGQAKPGPASFAGRYEGSAVTPDGVEAFVADFKVENGLITGTITTPSTTVTVTGGTVTADTFALSIDLDGDAGSITGTIKDGQFNGQWVFGSDGGSFMMKRADAPAPAKAGAAPAAAPAPPAVPGSKTVAPPPAAAPGADPISGDWDAVIDMAGNQMPFVLSMKLDGQKVAGQLGSEMGTYPFEGTWVNGTLNITFTSPNGMAISMAATIVDGKLAGTFSMADGQFTGGWAAAKRK